ncbi:MAG: DUF763 domain-containing protein [Candidatus Micrarchaeales archaeon]|nr:DUF763 domain-containing protein [Candidatus Micrarchaeales archaeon]
MHSATELPLHGGKAPRWLFHRMVRLSGAISNVIMDEFGADELLLRLSDPNWFQALSCAIGYDWHSSGTTTVTIGALKEALNGSGEIFIAGGKGKAGMKTPEDIEKGTAELSISAESEKFKENSRLSAKIDSALVYDRLGIYHHSFIFSKSRKWTVVQQGMFTDSDTAVRFQWFSESVDKNDIANEPHIAIHSHAHIRSLDLTSHDNAWARSSGAEAIHEYNKILNHSYPHRHGIKPDIDLSKRAQNVLKVASELDPKDYKEILLTKGIGRATLRSLALVSSLIYDKELAYRDPVLYSYNLGGKDGIPFPVPRMTYDGVVRELEGMVDSAHVETREKYYILKRLKDSLSNGSN